jgi:hypothetical protein
MAEVKELTQEELKALKEINSKYNAIVLALGENEIILSDINLKKDQTEKEKSYLLSDYSKLKVESETLSKTLVEKYGPGSIDLETGKIQTV